MSRQYSQLAREVARIVEPFSASDAEIKKNAPQTLPKYEALLRELRQRPNNKQILKGPRPEK